MSFEIYQFIQKNKKGFGDELTKNVCTLEKYEKLSFVEEN